MENTPVEILVSSDQKALNGRDFQTIRVSVHVWNSLYNDPWGEFKPIIRRVDFDKAEALMSKLEAKYNVVPTSHHREQFELIAQKRAGV